MPNALPIPHPNERLYDYQKRFKDAGGTPTPGSEVGADDIQSYDGVAKQWVQKSSGEGGGPATAPQSTSGGRPELSMMGTGMPLGAIGAGQRSPDYRQGLGLRQPPPLEAALAGLRKIY